jgi:lipopolysaccharide/colanic/teichoic acid biosynthesis glycosyltransferase
MNGFGENSSCLNGKKTSWTAASAKPAATRALTARRFHLVSTPDPHTRMEELFGTVGARRWLNVTVAAIALVVMAPLMALIAVVIRVTSPGPVLFRQIRVGLDRRNDGNGKQDSRRQQDLGGRPFTMYKFRTMYYNETPERQMWATPDDPRVTPIGRVLRKTRLDELPQLWNVLRGDMNIVGPRPEQPDIFSNLRTQLERYHHRQRVLPGITGHAQINLNYDCTVETVQEKLLLDLQYIEQTSAMEDLKIMLLTLPVMVTGKGAW